MINDLMSYLSGYFRNLITIEMERQGISQAELSRQTGIDKSNLCNMLKGRRGSVRLIERCLDALEIEVIEAESNSPFLMFKSDK